MEEENNNNNIIIISGSISSPNARKMGQRPRWKAIPYILGSEALERLAMFAMMLNLMVYLLKVFNMEQVDAANVINIWSGVGSCLPTIGAFVADASLGKFKTIAIALYATLVGAVMLTLTAWVPKFHPPNCSPQQKECSSPNATQLAILIFGLCWLAIGGGGIRPCGMPLAVDQFDNTTPHGKKDVSSVFNWYYTSITFANLVSSTLIVYVQNKNWVLGFGLTSMLMLCSVIIFLCGSGIYFDAPGEGSIFSSIAQVFVASYKKHHLQDDDEEERVYYDPPIFKDDKTPKMNLTKQLKCLNKAAIIQENDLNPQGLANNPWRLCTIQQVEEVKSLIKILPIWASGIFCMIPVVQQGTFPVSQALKMDRHLGRNFEIPTSSFNVISLLTISLWLPCYDLYVQKFLIKIMKNDHGLTSLQKIVIGNIFSVLTMVTSGLVESKRRARAKWSITMSAMWLAPQYVLLGLCEVFGIIGHIEFYISESPVKMRSVSNSLHFLVMAGSSYVGTLVMNVVHEMSGKSGRDWLNSDLNLGRLDYYYFLIAGLSLINIIYVLLCVKHYHYKKVIV
ncbi:hypothetical protein PIB30_001536 [Stylosanthes scabra]|uniref:Uncharacterized protein n=1 Tax=Stylosanthes scabra TaxID=79078 RepID=A0ABU6R1R6_9FABA|nr:hypothetical protein [Stylosanthes scabra]